MNPSHRCQNDISVIAIKTTAISLPEGVGDISTPANFPFPKGLNTDIIPVSRLNTDISHTTASSQL